MWCLGLVDHLRAPHGFQRGLGGVSTVLFRLLRTTAVARRPKDAVRRALSAGPASAELSKSFESAGCLWCPEGVAGVDGDLVGRSCSVDITLAFPQQPEFECR